MSSPPPSPGPGRWTVLLVGVVLAGAVATACGHGRASTAPPTSPAGASGVATSGAPMSESPSPSATGVPNAKDVPLDTILRPGTVADRVLYSDLDGDGIDEIIVSAHAKARTAIGAQQPYLDVWSFTGRQFQRVFDATTDWPLGEEGPAEMLQSNPDVSAQQVSFVDLVDFRGDGTPEFVVGITTFGASVGPMDVWVISMRADGFHEEFFTQTTQDGTLTRSGDTEKLDTPFFRPNDPQCCPTKIEHDVIALDPSTGDIEIVRQTFTKP